MAQGLSRRMQVGLLSTPKGYLLNNRARKEPMLKSSRPFRSLSVPAIVLSATLGVMMTPTGFVLLVKPARISVPEGS
jgi:hypothetical protein